MRYEPENAPTDVNYLSAYIERELRRLATVFNNPIYQVLHSEPTKKRQGMVVWADGSDWNPGAGAGLYAYNAGQWYRIDWTPQGPGFDSGFSSGFEV